MGAQASSLEANIGDIDNPAPTDLDPEGFGDAFDRKYQDPDDEDADSTRDENEGREHYEAVGDGKLRRVNAPLLGEHYSGAQISRGALAKNIDDDNSDNPFKSRSGQGESSDDENDGSSSSASDDDPERQENLGENDNSHPNGNELGEEYVDPEDVEIDNSIDEDDEIDSDEAFGEGDEERFSKFRFRKAKHNADAEMADGPSGDEDLGDGGGENGKQDKRPSSPTFEAWSSESESDNDEPMSDEEDSPNEMTDNAPQTDAVSADKAAIRALMASEQKAVIANVSETVKADVAKGMAVKNQREAFNSLLNTRIRLQKAIAGANSLAEVTPKDHSESSSDHNSVEAAENAAIELFNGLTALRASLNASTLLDRKKRTFSATRSSTRKDYQDCLNLADAESRSKRRTTMSKWAEKTQLISSLQVEKRFSNANFQPLTTMLDSHLHGQSFTRHLSRTRTPRNCAPLQAKAGLQEDITIYDDADWYSLLLRDLVDAKMSSSANGTSTALKDSELVEGLNRSLSDVRRENKSHRKGLDVKASKGRKMRYTVHEKLQNFDAPRDIGTWEARRAEELFASLLGRKVRGGLAEDAEDGGEGDDDDDDDDVREAEGLRLFRGSGR